MPRPPSPGRLLVRLLEESATPILALDPERQIVFVNRSLGDWLGVEPKQLLGLRCDYHAASDDPLAMMASGLCPPPEAFTGQTAVGSVSRPAAGDRPFEQRPAQFARLAAERASDELLMVIVLPAVDGQPSALGGALTPERLHQLLLDLRSRLGKRFHISQLIGESDAIVRVREQVRIAAASRARVLIVGPPGSGRQHVARTIHIGQDAASIGPLIPIGCELVDAEQMQAALASVLRRRNEAPSDRPAAALLLSVDRLRPEAQQEIFGFLNLPDVELQTLCTARTSLQRLAAKGKFRSDLAYTLSTLTIALPALRSRRSDIPLLAQHFLEEENASGGRQFSGFQAAAMELLMELSWPGNIDELAQAVREARARSAGPQIMVGDLPDWVHLAKSAADRPPREMEAIRLDEFLGEIEKELLARALRATRGNKSKAAQLLGVNRPRLLRRLAQLGLIAPPLPAAEEPVIFEPLSEEPPVVD